jgi:hypothetical protein
MLARIDAVVDHPSLHSTVLVVAMMEDGSVYPFRMCEEIWEICSRFPGIGDVVELRGYELPSAKYCTSLIPHHEPINC